MPKIQIGCDPNQTSPLAPSWVPTIGVICGNLLRSCGSAETHTGKISEGRLGSYAKSDSGGSSQGST